MVAKSGALDYVTQKILHIDTNARYDDMPTDLEERARQYIPHPYLEEEPTVAEWFHDLMPTRAGVSQYWYDLFPSATWIGRYNLRWLLGDAIAGMFNQTFDLVPYLPYQVSQSAS